MTPDIHRRSLFAGGMGITLAALGLTACSSSTAATTSGAAPGAPGTTAAGSTTGGGGSNAGGAAGPTVKKADVPVGGGVVMQDANFVVTQPTAGTFKAFSKICTHQGCPVSQVSNNKIICTCHGSSFSATDGSVLGGPARKSLAEAKVTVNGDSLVIG